MGNNPSWTPNLHQMEFNGIITGTVESPGTGVITLVHEFPNEIKIVSIKGETDTGTVDFNVRKDGADIMASDHQADNDMDNQTPTTPASDTFIEPTERLDLEITATASSPTTFFFQIDVVYVRN